MNHSFKLRSLLVLVVSLALIFSKCSKDDTTNIGLITQQNNATLGNFLTDGNGRTLYIFSDDVNGQSNCTGACTTNWPIYYAPNLKPADGIDVNDFSTITRSDGNKQTTYKNKPLYYFSGDKTKGDVNGEASGNEWYVAKTDYSILIANEQLVGGDGISYTSSYQAGTGETQFFVDAAGKTLYTFTHDFNNVNKFTTTDATHNAIWPVFNTTIGSLPSTLLASDFSTITVADGSTQLTYKGNPLYYFSGDANPGDTKGISSVTPAIPLGIWHVAGPQSTTPATQPTVALATDATFGNILTDGSGRSLYFFVKNTKPGQSVASTGTITSTWPLFNTDQIVLPLNSTLASADFASIGADATKQVTYKGRPLHYFAPNHDGVIEAAGQKGGDNVGPGFWFVAKPDYSLMVANAQLVGADGQNYITGNPYTVGTGATTYFTDAVGHTLYAFANDHLNTNTYSGTTFPIFNTAITYLPTGLNATDFGTITVNGATQLTYKGWPIYTYTSDATIGDTKGVNFGAPGKWPIINGSTVNAQ